MSKGTPKRGIRIDDDLWNEAQRLAKENGDNLSLILRDRLREYVEGQAPEATSWWRALNADGDLLAETSDPRDFDALQLQGKPGITFQRLYERKTYRWVDETP